MKCISSSQINIKIKFRQYQYIIIIRGLLEEFDRDGNRTCRKEYDNGKLHG